MQTIQQSVRTGPMRRFRNLGSAIAQQWPWPVSVRLNNNRNMYVDLRSAIGRGLFMQGEFDPAVFEPLAGALQRGGTFLDIGANVGFYSMLALDMVGDTGAVHAFEIDERPLRCLRKTIQRERIRNLFVHEVAVGRTDGTARIAMRSDSGHTSIADGVGPGQVKMVSLDGWWRSSGVKAIQAIKIDIEGAELLALQGAQMMLREFRPVLVCELAEDLQARFDHTCSELLGFLAGLHYRTSMVTGAGNPSVVARPD